MSAQTATTLKSLRVLVQVRERQGKRLEAVLGHARKLLGERQAELDTAQADHARLMEEEAGAHRQRDELFNGAFNPDALLTLDFRINDTKAETMRGHVMVVNATKAVEGQNQAVRQAQREVRRNEERIERFKEQIQKLLRDRDAAIEDLAEDDAEEASTTRFITRVRAAKAEQESTHD